MINLYTDAATKGNPGPSGAGLLLVGPAIYLQRHLPLGIMSNHEAEFAAAIAGISWIITDLKLTDQTLQLISDSKILIDSLDKQYAKHYSQQVTELLALEANFPLVIHRWQNDRKNQGAHHLAQQGLTDILKKL